MDRPTSPLASLSARYFAFVFLVFAVACGSGRMPPAQRQPPAITSQPSSQSARVGQMATFSVTATGTAPLSYQWSRNGTPVSGATSPSYITPVLAPTDNGASFSVVIGNREGTVTSMAASLTVAPRAPKNGDWRFQGIDLEGASPAWSATGILYPEMSGMTFSEALAWPLQVGAAPGICSGDPQGGCYWQVVVSGLPAGVSGVGGGFAAIPLSELSFKLAALDRPDTVITGYDLEAATQALGLSWLQTSQPTGFELLRQTTSPESLQDVATQLGQQSRVITALAFNGASLDLMSYSWEGDTTTVYEVKTVTATGDTVITVAADLSAQGYIISAMGGDPIHGLVLVGTRVLGDTMPRPFESETPRGTNGQLPRSIQTLHRDVEYYGHQDYFIWIKQQ